MWGRKRKVKNTAEMVDAGRVPQARQVTITEPANPWPLIVIILIVSIPFLLWVFWGAAVFVLDKAGFDNPAGSLANTLMALAVISLVLIVIQWFSRVFLNNYFEHKERMEQYRLDALQITLEAQRYQQLTAQSQPTTSRATDEDRRWVWIVTAVMFKAYDAYATGGKFAGNSRPWARRQVLAIRLRDGSTPTENEAGQVRRWLEERLIVKDDQINIDRFPDLAAVQELLNRLYDIPVQVMVNDNALLRSNEGYQHIGRN